MPSDDILRPEEKKSELTEKEIKAQMELIRGKDRVLLTEEERSSWHNISHNSDNGYLYQDADFLCGAIIKDRKALSACRALLKKHEWLRIVSGFQCPECEVVWHSKAILKHAPGCLWAQAIEKGE